MQAAGVRSERKPGQPAPGAETVYRAADMAIEAKEQVEQWGSEAGDVIARATDVIVPAVTEIVQSWSADAGETVSQATTSAEALVASGSQSLQNIAVDKRERDKVLLVTAAVALTAARPHRGPARAHRLAHLVNDPG
jgi:hypothetical protein